jgi:3-hydroxyisobutyrate dehydrogenase-like beta-hydroxyacid dehydrogenase
MANQNIETVALLHPGNMGATIGAAVAAGGARVLWASQDRGSATRRRAAGAKLIDAGSLGAAVRGAQAVLSVCPPHAAVDVARAVAAEKFSGIYVDANAVSRETAEEIGKIVEGAGASFVDGGIIGSPVKQAGTTRLYLSGARASDIAALFQGSMLDARAIGAEPGAASALKVAYAAWTKGTDALILAIRAYAAHEGVDQALLEERLPSPCRRCGATSGRCAKSPKLSNMPACLAVFIRRRRSFANGSRALKIRPSRHSR